MEAILHLGPLALPWAVLLVALSWIAGSAVHEWLAKRGSQPAGVRHSWLMGLVALLAARLGYVLNYATEYGAAPWSMLDIRDGGWAPWWGVSAVVAYLVFLWAGQSPWRKSVTAGTACALALWLAGSALLQGLGGPRPAPRNDLPAWSTVALDNTSVALAALRGQPVVVNLWATWCPPCRREMPVLKQASERNPKVRFLWVNQGEARELAARYAEQQGLPAGAVLLDTQSELGRIVAAKGLPTTLFFNADGQLVATRIGELSAATLAERLRMVLPPR